MNNERNINSNKKWSPALWHVPLGSWLPLACPPSAKASSSKDLQERRHIVTRREATQSVRVRACVCACTCACGCFNALDTHCQLLAFRDDHDLMVYYYVLCVNMWTELGWDNLQVKMKEV